MGNSDNSMLGGQGVFGPYMQGEERDSSRPFGIQAGKLGILESMGIYTPAQKQAMQTAQDKADALLQHQQDAQAVRMSHDSNAPLMYGLPAARQLGGLLGSLAGGKDPTAPQPQDQQDPLSQMISQAGNDPDALLKVAEAATRMGDPRGLALSQYAMKQKQEQEKAALESENTRSTIDSRKLGDKKTQEEIDGTLPPAKPFEYKATTTDGAESTRVFDSTNPKADAQGYVETGHGIKATKVSQTNIDGSPTNKETASKEYEKLGDMTAVAMQGADLINEMVDRIDKNGFANSWGGSVAAKAMDLSTNVKGLMQMAAGLGRKTDDSVAGALAGDLNHYSDVFSELGIDNSQQQRGILTLAYLLAAQDQKTASISDNDIKHYLEMVGGKHSSPEIFRASMEANKKTLLNKVDYYAATHDDGKTLLADLDQFKGMRQKLQDKMYPKGQAKTIKYPEGTIITNPKTNEKRRRMGGKWVPYSG